MANGMLESILGFDPVEYQQKRLAAIMAPMQSGSSYQRLGAALGTLASRALGGPDPQLARISRIKQIQRDAALASGGDRVKALEIMQAELSADPELSEYSTNVADILDKLKSEQTKRFAATQEMVSKAPEALTGEATRLANVITRKAAAAGITAQIDPETGALVTPLTAQEQAVIDAFPESQQLNQLSQVASRGAMKIEKEFTPETVKTSELTARVANQLGFGVKPNLADYTQEQQTAINAKIEEFKKDVEKAGVPQPGQVDLTTLARAQDIIDQYTKGASERLSNIQPLRTQLNLAKQGNGAAFEQVRGQLIKLVGDSQISNTERARITGGSGIIEDAINKINTLFTGLPTQDKLNEIERIAVAFEDVYANQFNKARDKADNVLAQGKIAPETRAALIPPRYVSGAEKAKATISKAPAVGTIQNGYRFKGGNPADKNNWEQVK